MIINRKALFQKHKSESDKWLKTHRERPQVTGLFLGTGESGKSTIFKQMRLNYGKTFDDFERAQYGKVIWVEALRAMRALIDRIDTSVRLCPDTATNITLRHYAQMIQALDLSYAALMNSEMDELTRKFMGSHMQGYDKAPKKFSRFRFGTGLDDMYTNKISEPSLIPDPLEMLPLRDRPGSFTPDRRIIAFAISELWQKSPALQSFATTEKADIDPNMHFFFDRILKFANPYYLPDNEEVLYARIKTTGMISCQFRLPGAHLEIIDVGGQRTERRKWIHCFDDATCILYVASIGDYFVTRNEEEGPINSMIESLQVFRKTLESPYLKGKPVALFLNKTDFLEKNLRAHPFKHYYPKYAGEPYDMDAICAFIEGLFRKALPYENTSCYCYHTCATDLEGMKFVIEAVTNMVFIENLQWAGMM